MHTTTKLRHIAGILGSMVPAPAPELTFDEILRMQEQLEAANPPAVPGHYVQTSGMNRKGRRTADARARRAV